MADNSGINGPDPKKAKLSSALTGHHTPTVVDGSRSRASTPVARQPRDKKESWKIKEAKGEKVKPSNAAKIQKARTFLIRPPPYVASDFLVESKAPTLIQPPISSQCRDENELPSKKPVFYCTDRPVNRRGYRYLPCAAAPSMPGLMYRNTDMPPFSARIDWSDMDPKVLCSEDALAISTEKGFRMGRANVVARRGTDWFVEFEILRGGGDCGGHVRVGWVRREAVLSAPVGFDGYSYGIRDVGGEAMHCSRPKPFLNEKVKTGDVLGFHIHIPGPEQHSPDAFTDLVRERIPIRYKGQLYFEQWEYLPKKEMEDLLNPGSSASLSSTAPPPSGQEKSKDEEKNSQSKSKKQQELTPKIEGSYIQLYLNGENKGKVFEDLYDFVAPYSRQASGKNPEVDDGWLGYYPAISAYKGGCALLNCGPNFKFPPEGLYSTMLPMCQRYDEQIAEDIVWDIVDEIDMCERLVEEENLIGQSAVTQIQMKELVEDE